MQEIVENEQARQSGAATDEKATVMGFGPGRQTETLGTIRERPGIQPGNTDLSGLIGAQASDRASSPGTSGGRIRTHKWPEGYVPQALTEIPVFPASRSEAESRSGDILHVTADEIWVIAKPEAPPGRIDRVRNAGLGGDAGAD